MTPDERLKIQQICFQIGLHGTVEQEAYDLAEKSGFEFCWNLLKRIAEIRSLRRQNGARPVSSGSMFRNMVRKEKASVAQNTQSEAVRQAYDSMRQEYQATQETGYGASDNEILGQLEAQLDAGLISRAQYDSAMVMVTVETVATEEPETDELPF